MLNKTIILLGVDSYKKRVTNKIRRHYPYLKSKSFTPNRNDTFEQIVEKIKKHDPIAILNRGEEFIELHSRLVDHFQLPGPSYSAIKLFRDKAFFHKMMVKNDLSKYRPQTAFTTLKNLAEDLQRANFPVVIKPYQGAKSRGVSVLNSPDDLTEQIIKTLRDHFANEPSLQDKDEQKILIEEFIVGQQITSTSYVDHKGKLHTLGFIDVLDGRDFGATHQQLISRTTPSYYSYDVKNQIINLLQKLVDISGLRSTFIHPDFIVSPDEKIRLIEINARMGGLRYEMSKYSSGIDLDLSAIQLSLGEMPNDKSKKHFSCTGIDVWSEETGIIKKIKIAENPHVVKSTVYLNDGDQYLPPPLGNQQLARIYIKSGSDSFTIAKKLLRKTKIVIK
ncbi:MAG: ATP-grasp domain-containing protein [Candidatus Pacebacteria bacterium]|jgi:biotin carboxylase|nr:ATP-grasp domain-containing protein [Candidatus Paceibacterota bacterium]MBT3511773.1 ATP-grasp domain-containing protein [Candidatus Paceibacterota bacterium]MBT4005198.1 ATP-grasp domain-containing protein [Candidatus Paceibacterota bacterium]MBT4359024.1 ATP-grasp domain-containing protein [Candidatus Paceibacterota bacterium]MBT4681299.1 ATP-grasp domain-containing protein [Candidatus Paceibacterota bacterium]